MKKKFRSFTAALLALLMVTTTFFAMPFTVSAAEATEAPSGATSGTTGDCTWTLDDNGVLTISGNGAMGDYTFDSRAPWKSLEFTEVVIEDGVTSIGESAFSWCENLSSIVIPYSVTIIGNLAFCNCENLTSVSFQEGLTEIGWGAFDGCINLTNIIIPESVTSIRFDAFFRCSGLTDINIPKNVTSIESCAFLNCSNLASITVDERNPIYDSRENCNAIIETESNTLILGCNTTVIPYSVTSIGEYAFTELENLTLITIPENVTHIDDSAIHCPNLSVIFGKKGSCAETYANTQNIKFIGLCTIAEGTTGNCTWSIDAYGILTISGDISGDGVMEDYSYDNPAPWKDYELSAVIIDDYVTTIGDYAFSNCSNLRHVVISNSVNSIGIDSFSGCSNMTIHGKEDSFAENYATSNNIPFISFTGSNFFDKTGDCIWIITIDFEAEKVKLVIFGNGVMLDYYDVFPSPWKHDDHRTEVIIEDGVTDIGKSAFESCDGLTDITIPYSVTRIGEYAFYNCDNLTDVYYYGTQESWNEINIGNHNENLTSANIHFLASTVCDHTYGDPVWTWDGYSAATAAFACAECDDVQEITANVTTEITKEPTCTETGIRTCTATVTFNGNTYTDTKEKTVPATGHSYGEPTWTWDGYSAATATFTCAEGDDTQVKNATVTTKITTAPTCTETGIRTCTAKVTFNGTTYTDTKKKTVPATGHSYGETTWIWNGYSAATATFACTDCDDAQVKKAKVTTKVTKEPTCTETGIRTCTATLTFNGNTYTDTKEKTIPAVH
ncbi:MAG: leucine-rich repeat protein, partial [Ruminococcus sp.]|nr:leucine-rich repeat protein [Ruminococcus sp.]